MRLSCERGGGAVGGRDGSGERCRLVVERGIDECRRSRGSRKHGSDRSAGKTLGVEKDRAAGEFEGELATLFDYAAETLDLARVTNSIGFVLEDLHVGPVELLLSQYLLVHRVGASLSESLGEVCDKQAVGLDL